MPQLKKSFRKTAKGEVFQIKQDQTKYYHKGRFIDIDDFDDNELVAFAEDTSFEFLILEPTDIQAPAEDKKAIEGAASKK